MKNISNTPRENNDENPKKKVYHEPYTKEKNRMDYEGGNQGLDTSNHEVAKDAKKIKKRKK